MRFRNRCRELLLTTLVALGMLCPGRARAATMIYPLHVPDGRSVTYRLELDVRHPGDLSVIGEWPGTRALAFRLEHPDGRLEQTVRRTGTSPLRMVAEIDAEDAGTWTLRVHALPARGAIDGTLTIETPEPRPVAPEPPSGPAAPSPPVETEPWLSPRPVPAGLPQPWQPFLQAVESFRSELARTRNNPPVDSCRWQSPLMRYLAETRDELMENGRVPDSRTRDFLRSVAEAIDTVERLQSSTDPLLAGPPPDDPSLRDAWHKIRSSRLHEIEGQLDELFRRLRRGLVPALEQEAWTMRLVSCLTACERFFDERTLVGIDRAVNRTLAEDQWDRVQLAGRALDSLAAIEGGRARR